MAVGTRGGRQRDKARASIVRVSRRERARDAWVRAARGETASRRNVGVQYLA